MEYSLEKLFIYLSWKCNLHCKHCWVSSNYEKHEVLSEQCIERAIIDSLDLGLETIKISGGEPTLFPESIYLIIDLCRKYNLELNIETNGTLLDEKLVNSLSSISSYVNISIDSYDEKIHNSIRGIDNAFQETLKGLDLLKKYSIPFNVTYTVSKMVEKEIDMMIELLSKYHVSSMKINPIMNLGRAKQNLSSFPYLINVEEYEKLIRKYHGNNFNGVHVTTMVPPCFLSPPEMITMKKTPVTCGYLNQLSILPNGEIGLCGEAKNISVLKFGDLKNQSIKDIWNHSSNLKKLRDSINKGLNGVCGLCSYQKSCMGGCRIASYLIGGHINDSNPFAASYYDINKRLPYLKVKK